MSGTAIVRVRLAVAFVRERPTMNVPSSSVPHAAASLIRRRMVRVEQSSPLPRLPRDALAAPYRGDVFGPAAGRSQRIALAGLVIVQMAIYCGRRNTQGAGFTQRATSAVRSAFFEQWWVERAMPELARADPCGYRCRGKRAPRDPPVTDPCRRSGPAAPARASSR